MYNILNCIKDYAHKSRQYINENPLSKAISIIAVTGLTALVCGCTTLEIDSVKSLDELETLSTTELQKHKDIIKGINDKYKKTITQASGTRKIDVETENKRYKLVEEEIKETKSNLYEQIEEANKKMMEQRRKDMRIMK